MFTHTATQKRFLSLVSGYTSPWEHMLVWLFRPFRMSSLPFPSQYQTGCRPKINGKQ